MSAYCYVRIRLRCEKKEHQLWLCQHVVMSAVVASACFNVGMFAMSENTVMSGSWRGVSDNHTLISVLHRDSMALHVHPESLSRVCHERVTILASRWPLVLCFLASAFIVKAFV